MMPGGRLETTRRQRTERCAESGLESGAECEVRSQGWREAAPPAKQRQDGDDTGGATMSDETTEQMNGMHGMDGMDNMQGMSDMRGVNDMNDTNDRSREEIEEQRRARERAAERAADRKQVAKARAERDRRIRQRAKKAVDEWVKLVLPGYVAMDLHGQLTGAPEGIVLGWCRDVGTLMNRLDALSEQLSEEEADQATVMKDARQAVLAALHRMRPDIGLMPWFDMSARTGAMAELAQYAAATRRLARDLMRLYQECQTSPDGPDGFDGFGGFGGPLMLPW